MNELTTSHQLFLGKDYSRRNTQEQLMEDEDGNNAWTVNLTITRPLTADDITFPTNTN